MSSQGRFLSCLVTIGIALAGLVTVGGLPAAASNSGTIQYVALGDSYAAGRGAGSYLNSCLQSSKGYPELLDSAKRIHLQANSTCSGATTSDVADTQLSALNHGTRLVTLTVGGNDLDVSGLATVCSTQPADCLAEINMRLALLTGLGSRLADLYADVADAAPKAQIVVTGYPHLFEPLPPSDPNAAIIKAINNAVDALNTTIQHAVSVTHATDINIVYVDVTEEFRGHGIGSREPFINAAGADAFHPNAAGYLAYAAAISAALPGARVDGQLI